MDENYRVPFAPTKPFEEVRTDAGLISEGAKDLVRTKFITVTEGPAILSSGKRVPDFYSIRRGDAVNIIPFFSQKDEDGNLRREFVVIRKVKTASGIAYYSFPGGMLPPNCDPQDWALTELREETGMGVYTIVPLGYVHRGPESCADRDFFFFANIGDSHGLQDDPEEGSTVRRVSPADLFRLVMYQYFDPYHAIGLWRALRFIGQSDSQIVESLKEALDEKQCEWRY